MSPASPAWPGRPRGSRKEIARGRARLSLVGVVLRAQGAHAVPARGVRRRGSRCAAASSCCATAMPRGVRVSVPRRRRLAGRGDAGARRAGQRPARRGGVATRRPLRRLERALPLRVSGRRRPQPSASSSARPDRHGVGRLALGSAVVAPAVTRPFSPTSARAAARGELTDDCRDGRCASCGVCGAGVEMDAAAVTWWLLTFARGGPAATSRISTRRAPCSARSRAPASPSRCLRACGPSRGSRCRCRCRWAPRAARSWPSSKCRTTRRATAAALRELRAAAPPGLAPLAIDVVGEQHPRPQASKAEYACLLEGDAGAVLAAVERYATEVSVVYERVSPKGRRTLDLKEYVVHAAADAEPGGA